MFGLLVINAELLLSCSVTEVIDVVAEIQHFFFSWLIHIRNGVAHIIGVSQDNTFGIRGCYVVCHHRKDTRSDNRPL